MTTVNQRYQAERELLARDFRMEYQSHYPNTNTNTNTNNRARGGGGNPLNPLLEDESAAAARRTGRRRLGGGSDLPGGASASAPFATATPAASEKIGRESAKYGLFSKKTSADYGQRELSLMQKIDARPQVSFKQPSAASPSYAAAPPGMPVRAGPPRDALDIFSDEMSDKLKPQVGKRRQPWQQQGQAGKSPWGEW